MSRACCSERPSFGIAVPGFMAGDKSYHLTSASPLVDAGTDVGAPSDDIDGDARPLGAATDIGADEVAP